MNKELEQQARGWYEAEERKRLASVLDTNGDPMFDEETISVASAANARSLAPRLAAFVAHLEAQSKPIQGEVDGWISVDDRLPEYGNPVLIVVLDITSMGYREKITGGGHMWFYIDGDPISYSEEPTHWQPLPPPPVRASPQ